MKALNYFLFFFLTISFSSTAQEEILNNPHQSDSIASEVDFYYINPCPPIRTARIKPTTYRGYDYDAWSRSFLMREYYFDIAFHNAHTGKNVGLVMTIDDGEIQSADFKNRTAISNDVIEVERYYTYGQQEFMQQPGLLHPRDLFGWRAIR